MASKTTFRAERWDPKRKKWVAGFEDSTLAQARIAAELASGSFWREKVRIIKRTVTESVVK